LLQNFTSCTPESTTTDEQNEVNPFEWSFAIYSENQIGIGTKVIVSISI